MIYREARKLHIFHFLFPAPSCLLFCLLGNQAFNFFRSFPVKSKDWTTAYFEQFKSWRIEPIRSAQWKSVHVLRRKNSRFLANQVNLKAEVYSVPKFAHSQLTCTRQNSCLIPFQCYIASYFLCSLDKNLFLSRSCLRLQCLQISWFWNVTLSRHFRLTRLQLQLPKSKMGKMSFL